MRTTVALCLLAMAGTIGLAACTQHTDPKTAAYWIDRLDNKTQRNEALKELGQIGDKSAVPVVLKWFQEQGEWQPDAAYTLGQLHDPSVVGKLVAGIDYAVGTGRDKLTRIKNRTNQNIAKALGNLKAKAGVKPLVRLLNASVLATREAAIEALGEIGDAQATQPLIKVALGDGNAFLRKRAVQALGKIGDPKAVPALIQMLYIEVPGTSFYNEARYSLLQVGKPAIPELMKTLQRKNKDVESIRLQGDQPIADGAVEAKVAFVLGALQAKEAEPLMIKALGKYYKKYKSGGPMYASVPGAVMELAYAVGDIGGPAAVKALLPIAMDANPNIRTAATEALTTIGDTGAVKTLLAAARKGSVDARRPAIIAVSRLGGGDVLKAYDNLPKAAGKNAKVVSQIVQAERSRLLAAKDCGKQLACWTKKLGDKNLLVRERAAYELGWLGDKAADPALLKAAEDTEAQVRMAAVLSLNRLGAVAPAKLQAIHDKWKNKIEYRNVNLELRRVIARLGAQNG